MILANLVLVSNLAAQSKLIIQHTELDPVIPNSFTISTHEVVLGSATPTANLLNQYTSSFVTIGKPVQVANDQFMSIACDQNTGGCLLATQSSTTGQLINAAIRPNDLLAPTNCIQGYDSLIPVITIVGANQFGTQFGIGLLGNDLTTYAPNLLSLPFGGTTQFGQYPASNVEIDCINRRVAYSFLDFSGSTPFGFKVVDFDANGAVVNDQVFLSGLASYPSNIKLLNNNMVALAYYNRVEVRDLSPAFNLLGVHQYDPMFFGGMQGISYDSNSNQLYVLGSTLLLGTDLDVYQIDLNTMTGNRLGLGIIGNPFPGISTTVYNGAMVLMQ